MWHQQKLNLSLKKACMLGNYKIVMLIIRAGANNFDQCIKECCRKGRPNHILAYLRLCQAAYEDDQTAVDILLEWGEVKISDHPCYASLVDFNDILRPLIDNGTLTISQPLHVALKAKHLATARKILYRVLRQPNDSMMIDWHGLELKELEKNWLNVEDFPNMQLLCLSVNSLTQFPMQITYFTTLVKLQVAFNKLTSVPFPIFQMPCIKSIDLSYNLISALPEALSGGVSTSLQILLLSNNQLSRFPKYFSDSAVRTLDLSRNQFKEVPNSICLIQGMEHLNMSNNMEIRFVPYTLGGLKYLKVASFDGLPYTFNIPDSSPMEFIQKRFESMQMVSHYEVVMIGFPHHFHVLEGVYTTVEGSELDCALLKFNSPTHFLNLYHVFHLPNAIYLLLWDCENSQNADELHRVLRHLSIYTPESPVVVTACWQAFEADKQADVEEKIAGSMWKDLRDMVQLEHLVIKGDSNYASNSTSCYSQHFLDSISKLSDQIKLTQLVPGSYYECGKILAQKRKCFLTENKCPLLSEEEFWEEVTSMPSYDLSSRKELPKLISYLSLAGVVIHIHGPIGVQSCFVINRQWFCSILGNVVLCRGAQIIKSFSGVVHHEGLFDLFNSSCLSLPLPGALQYMLNKEAVALALSSEKWLIPSMLRERHDNLANIDPDQYGIRRQYTVKLTPATFWCRLLAHLLMNMDNFVREVSDINFSRAETSQHHLSSLSRQGVIDWSYWSRGIVCWQNACHLVYSIEAIKSYSDPFQETIEIRVPNNIVGYRVMHRISLLIDALLKNWFPKIWSSVEIWVPCSYCIHAGIPNIPLILFHDTLLAVAKGVGVKCLQHPEKIVDIAKIIPDLVHESVSQEVFLPPESVEFNINDKSSCLSPLPSATVFKGMLGNVLVAVKPFLHDSSITGCRANPSCQPILQMWSEFEIFRHIRNAECPHIINILGMCPQPLCLVFQYTPWSSLDDVFQLKNVTISHLIRLRMIYQLASALSVLQSHRVIHRNICLANLLVFSLSIDDVTNIKLAGFSNACYSINQGVCVGECGTFPAPEMVQSNEGEYDERVDIFAFAFVAYEIIIQSRMHVTSNVPLEQRSMVTRPSLDPVRIRAPYLVPLISKCWHPDRTKRPFASKVVQLLKHPLHMLVCDGKLVNKNHEFFAASARFTRVQDGFCSDLFVCSGQLMESRTTYLSRVTLPGLNFAALMPLPSEFVICMGCIGSQLWVSFFGRTVHVYSALTLEFINEFTFRNLVVAITTSPTSVYLGLENGMLQIYNAANSVPTEPTHSKLVHPGEEFKCLEALEDSLICATKCTIFCLHPDTLAKERQWEMDPIKEIRCIAVSNSDDNEVDGNELLWVAFRRWEKFIVMNPWTGEHYYCIDCAKIVNRPALKVYVQSLRVVLDTVWVGLNSGHILMFASTHKKPQLLSHLKVHKQDVRQLLLLHPSYMGPTTVLSSSEISRNLQDPNSNLITDHHRTIYPESVRVVSFGTGLEQSLCSVDSHGIVVDNSDEEDSETSTDGLFAVVLEGTNTQRTLQIERNSERLSLLYMNGCTEASKPVYFDDSSPYAVPRKLTPQCASIPRIDSWSASNVSCPVYSNFKCNHLHYDAVKRSSPLHRNLESREPYYDTVHQPSQNLEDISLSLSVDHVVIDKQVVPSKKKKPPVAPRVNRKIACTSDSSSSSTNHRTNEWLPCHQSLPDDLRSPTAGGMCTSMTILLHYSTVLAYMYADMYMLDSKVHYMV